MSNPQDNPGTPPQPTSSDSSTPPQPSTTPQPWRRHVKMFARKIVATGALLKILNAQLKASQAQESEHSDDSFKSASEGEGTRSSDSEKIQNSPSAVHSVLVESVENRFVVGSVRDVEMPELRRRGSKNKNEKEKEKEGASCDVRGTGVEVVDSSPTSEMIRPTICGTEDEIVGNRSGEVDQGRLLRVCKKKRMDKGKAKVAESSEAVDVEEIEQVHQEEHTIVERTRSAVKNKQVRITEEEEWNGEEKSESDGEQDKLAKFGKRNILKGRLLKDLVELGMVWLIDALAVQSWKDMVLQMDGRLARNEIIEFMANAEVKDGIVTSQVKEVQVTFDAEKLGEILDIPAEGYDDYTRRFCNVPEVNEAKFVHKSEMKPQHKVLFEFVNKCLLPRLERRHIANYMDLVPLKKWEMATSKDYFGINTLIAYDYEVIAIPNESGLSNKTPLNSKVIDLVQESGAKDAEIARLKARLAEVESERDGLRTELTKEKEKNDGILQNICPSGHE
ncbi:uncharacterized protein [Nicotiana sylvestris]|uniref:uncharacterized protein n=1 Tax=Nicotiana sylvestris TaxID=4096 RepID=UPI00388CB409